MDPVLPVGSVEDVLRQSLIEISQCPPENEASPNGSNKLSADSSVAKVSSAASAEQIRSELISISYLESPYTKTPPPVQVPAP